MDKQPETTIEWEDCSETCIDIDWCAGHLRCKLSPPPVCWNDIWVAKQELGAALRPVFECRGAPPEWATRLGDLLEEIEPVVAELAMKEDQDG